ncbi:MAG: cysteine hydrolase [Alphaproteobacteria bacterium]|jgi:nicotinamidase-related amidase|nr:cysteine hydrolase [Alphaproteobacteria bacterium]
MADGLIFGTLPATTRHLCVDMQRLFAADGPWPTPWMDRVLPVVESLVAHDPARTIFTRFIPPLKAEDMPGSWQRYYTRWEDKTRARLDPDYLDLVPSLARFVPPAQVVDKPVYSALAGRRLPMQLAAQSVDSLVISGSETDVCVLATVLAAVDHGFRVVIVEDGICSSSDPGHDALLGMYRQRFSQQIEIATADQLLQAWPDRC